ncbi:MAG TPA: hypothetical protein VGP46_01540, partial [Acidimicrobiales bacterium]|nr:hypothetical protein [Acidimicrobiales bacterium]
AERSHLRRLTDPITDSSVGQYRSFLTQAELAVVEHILQEDLRHFAYGTVTDLGVAQDDSLPRLQARLARQLDRGARRRRARMRLKVETASLPLLGHVRRRGEPLIWSKSAWLAHKEDST